MPLTFGSLFAGIGGFDLGFERAGMVCKWQVEKDPFCQKVLAKHWPDVKRYKDVREVGKHNLEPVDVICGGFPCQDISAAGHRKGILPETRSGLWFEYYRIIRELRPRYIVVENVENLLRQGIDIVLRDLAQCGYNARWEVLPAAAFGAQHIRKRVFIVAYPVSWNGSRGEVHFGNELQTLYREQAGSSNAMFQRCPNVAEWVETTGENWEYAAGICRMANGVPHRVDRLRSLGNAVVPQVAEFIATLVIRAYNKHLQGTPTAAPLSDGSMRK